MRFFTRTASTGATTLAKRLGDRAVHILDVRQPAEWRRSHIRGSHNLPLTQLKRRLATLPREQTIVTVCASGHRSKAAARTLQRAGYEVENLKGGMRAWAKVGLPVQKTRRR
jgi:rhodanese-related sulfurtransferase